MDQHSKLSWRLHLIARALGVNQIPTAGVAYMASEDEWQSLIEDVRTQTYQPVVNLHEAAQICYMGITVIKPKTLL